VKGFRILGWIALLAATAAVLAAALAALAWRSLAARDGEWSQPLTFTVLGRRVEQRVGMAVLLRLATHPLAAKAIDGRSFDSAQGRWHVAAQPDGAVSAHCEPCRFTLRALGPAPLRVERAELVLRADTAPSGRDRAASTLAGVLRSTRICVLRRWRTLCMRSAATCPSATACRCAARWRSSCGCACPTRPGPSSR
jgi:hypothetical protein